MRQRTFHLITVGVFAALLVITAQIALPSPFGVPFTLQTFSVALCGITAGYKRGVLALSVYLVLGAAGLPVFAGFQAGLGVLFGVTGGFLWGFLPFVLLCGIPCGHKWAQASLGLLGLVCCHLLGAVQFSLVTKTGFGQALLLCSAPYILKDILSLFAALAVSVPLLKAFSKIGYQGRG